MLRSNLATAFGVALVAACGGDSNAPARPTLVPAALSVVSGDQQHDTVMATLSQPVAVVVTADGPNGTIMMSSPVAPQATTGAPVPNQIINFRVTDPDCGQPFAGTAITDAQGQAKERWELGNKAKLCHMEARAVDQVTGAPLVFDTATATAVPATPWSFTWTGTSGVGGIQLTMAAGDSIDLHTMITAIVDKYGNAVDVGTVTPRWYATTSSGGQCTSGCGGTLGWMLHAPGVAGSYGLAITFDRGGGSTGTLTVTP